MFRRRWNEAAAMFASFVFDQDIDSQVIGGRSKGRPLSLEAFSRGSFERVDSSAGRRYISGRPEL